MRPKGRTPFSHSCSPLRGPGIRRVLSMHRLGEAFGLGLQGEKFCERGRGEQDHCRELLASSNVGFPTQSTAPCRAAPEHPTDTGALLNVPVHSLCLQEVLSPFLTSGDAPWELHPPQPPGLLRAIHSGPDSSTKW